MQLPTGQLDTLRNDAAALLDACAGSGSADADDSLAQGFEQLFDVLARAESDRQSGGDTGDADVTQLGRFALELTENLAARIGQSGDSGTRQSLAALNINIALWIARHGGVIESLEPVVDALAQYANSTMDTNDLEALSAVIQAVVGAVSPVISQDLEKANPGRPWRILLLNQSIVATRSHNAGLMETAFAALTQHLPEDAAQFFTEGMQQMDALNYPDHVREVMARYHRQWTLDRSLH